MGWPEDKHRDWRQRTRTARTAILALGLAAPPLASQTLELDTREVDDPWLERVRAVLDLARSAAAPSETSLRLRLRALGPDAVEALFAEWCHACESLPTTPREGGSWRERQRALCGSLLSSTLAAWHRPHLHTLLARTISSSGNTPRQIAGLRLLAEIGDGADFKLCDSLARRQTESSSRDRVHPWFSFAVRGILERDERAFAQLRSAWPTLTPELRPLAVQAVVGTRQAAGLSFLISLLGRWSDSRTLLESIDQLASAIPIAPENLQIFRVQMFLNDPDPLVSARAARCLGSLGAVDGVESLIELLDDPLAVVHQNAHRALLAITGTHLSRSAVLWKRWVAQENEWLEREYPRLLGSLRSNQPNQVFAAIRAMCGHPLHRGRHARDFGSLLSHANPAIRRLACQGLAQLREPRARSGLERALQDGDATVREVARNALETLTATAPHRMPPARRPSHRNPGGH